MRFERRTITAAFVAVCSGLGTASALAQTPNSAAPMHARSTPEATAAPGDAPPEKLPVPATTSAPTDPSAPAVNDEAKGPEAKAPESIWKKVPPVRGLPRPGNFPIPPSGPGYYSLLDELRGVYREKPPPFPYPPFGLMQNSFFDADFRYLDDPKPNDPFFPFKRIRLGDNWMFSTGGDVRWRYTNENDSRLTRSDNTYNLVRSRVYGDLWYRDFFRVYVEGIWADSLWHDLPPLPIDINRGDFLNLFVDLKVFELDNRPVYARVGRQELLFGSQRLVSPLEWANTRRTFQGARLLYTGDKWDFDLFWVRPVVPVKDRLDSVDDKQNFAGAFLTHRPKAGTFLDAYYLFLDNSNRVTQQGIVRSPVNVHTLGGRAAGDVDGRWLYDVESAIQLGSRGSQSLVAGMATAGAGYHFKDTPLNPTFWAYYDWASGDNSPNTGNFTTFNQLFPFGHYYLGWIDLVGRQNIQDMNFHLFLYPTNWITFWTQYHNFWLADSRDALYNAAGVGFRRDPTGRAGNHVGQEIDIVVNFHLSPRSDILTGYSKLYGGQFLQRTTGPNRAADSELYYLQYTFRW